MPVEEVTNWPTEADLESEIQVALRRAFPWLPQGAIRHQTKFSFTFGRKQIHVEGAKDSRAAARADILLYSGDKPLAVLELKRPGNAIDAADIEQGLSYARLLYPSPPLVVVTDGKDLSLLETHTGKEWNPSQPSEAAFARLIQAATLAASADLKRAVGTLMGSSPSIWTQAVRHTSAAVIAELSGDWNDPLLPFVPNFLIPRKATAITLNLLRKGERLVLIEGAPLAGKSNALREIAVQTADADDLVTLFVQAESGTGIFQQIADTLSEALSWPITRDEARDWLLRLSKTTEPALVIAVDGMEAERGDIRRDVEDLTSQAFGNNVRVVLALDDSLADRLVLNSKGRNKSAIGRRSRRLRLGSLEDDEFQWACELLWNRRIGIMKGGQASRKMRIPWILRAVTARIMSQTRYADETLAAMLPSLLGLDLIEHARVCFQDPELRRLLRETANAVLQDAEDRKRPIGLVLVSVATFVVRRKTLRQFLEHAEIETLVNRGFLRLLLHDSGEAIMVIRVPEFVASEAANLIGGELSKRAENSPEAAAKWLSEVAANIPLGDIVAAHAVLDAPTPYGGLPLNLITSLVKLRPKQEVISPGTNAAMYLPGAGVIDMTFQSDGSILLDASGQHHMIEPDSDPRDAQHSAYRNLHSWLILSHLAGRPFAIQKEGKPAERIDLGLLLEVGACPLVLRMPNSDPHMGAVLIHNIADHGEIVCHKAGIVEPITLSIFKFLGSGDPDAQDWIEAAIRLRSFPLLARIDIALGYLADSANPAMSGFAHRVLEDLVKPALDNLPSLH